MAYHVYDEFDKTEIKYQKNGDLMVCVEIWLISSLLSYETEVEIIEPKYLKSVLVAQAQEIYKKINLDKRCQDMCAILKIIAIQLYRSFKHFSKERGKENE